MPSDLPLADVSRAVVTGDVGEAELMLSELKTFAQGDRQLAHAAKMLEAKLLRRTKGFARSTQFMREYEQASAPHLDKAQRADVLSTIAENIRIQGRNAEAWSMHLALAREGHDRGDSRLWMWAVLGLGRIAFVVGNLNLSLSLFVDTARQALHLGDSKSLGWSVRGIAAVLVEAPRLDVALLTSLLDHADTFFAEASHQIGTLWMMQSRADLMIKLGSDIEAAVLLEKSRVGFIGIDPRGEAFAATKAGLLARKSKFFGPSMESEEALARARNYFLDAEIAEGAALIGGSEGLTQ